MKKFICYLSGILLLFSCSALKSKSKRSLASADIDWIVKEATLKQKIPKEVSPFGSDLLVLQNGKFNTYERSDFSQEVTNNKKFNESFCYFDGKYLPVNSLNSHSYEAFISSSRERLPLFQSEDLRFQTHVSVEASHIYFGRMFVRFRCFADKDAEDILTVQDLSNILSPFINIIE